MNGAEFGQRALRVMEYRMGQAWEYIIGSSELALVLHQIVEATVDRAQTQRRPYVGQQREQVSTSRLRLCDLDLFENEVQIGSYEMNTSSALERRHDGSGRCRWDDRRTSDDRRSWR